MSRSAEVSRAIVARLGLRENHQRYRRAVSFIGDSMSPVLEVGPASRGIAPLLKKARPVVYVDVLEKFGEGEGTSAVRGSADRLPFGSRTFFHVVCLDVMEHLPPDIRKAAVSELYRVTAPGGTLLISSPVGEAATKADEWLSNRLSSRGLNPHRWVSEHQQYGVPSIEDYDEWFSQFDSSTSVTVEPDLTVEAWKRALEVSAIPGSMASRTWSMLRFAAHQIVPPGDQDIYRQFFVIEKGFSDTTNASFVPAPPISDHIPEAPPFNITN